MNITNLFSKSLLAASLIIVSLVFTVSYASDLVATSVTKDVTQTLHKTVTVNGVKVFYREAGSKDAPTILLLHGFPTSSHMFRNLIPKLADRFHLIAPDYPGFGNSEQPAMDKFEYTFDNLANVMVGFVAKLGIKKYSVYLMDYGAPIGFRLAAQNPEQITSLIVQNGNAYTEGLREFWDPIRVYWKDRTPEKAKPLAGFIAPDGVKWQYTHVCVM